MSGKRHRHPLEEKWAWTRTHLERAAEGHRAAGCLNLVVFSADCRAKFALETREPPQRRAISLSRRGAFAGKERTGKKSRRRWLFRV